MRRKIKMVMVQMMRQWKKGVRTRRVRLSKEKKAMEVSVYYRLRAVLLIVGYAHQDQLVHYLF